MREGGREDSFFLGGEVLVTERLSDCHWFGQKPNRKDQRLREDSSVWIEVR